MNGDGVAGDPTQREIVSMFKPIDVLDGATELVDQDGTVIVIGAADLRVPDVNEYPADRTALYCEIRYLCAVKDARSKRIVGYCPTTEASPSASSVGSIDPPQSSSSAHRKSNTSLA